MSILGLLSDSHGDVNTTMRGVQLLVDAGAEVLIHMGDIGSEAVIDALILEQDERGELKPSVHVVPGNTDWNAVSLMRYGASLGVKTHNPDGRLTVGEKLIAFTHGHDLGPMQRAIDEELDYLFHGHTHQTRNERVGKTRVINPGALHRARAYTVAVLNTETDRVRFLTLE